MAASAKKGKKSKGKVVSLSEFLQDGDHGGSRSGEAMVMAPSKSSWADEMEEESIYKEKILLPTAPRAARGSDVDETRIPSNPPYTAYIANLPYDIEVEDIGKFFQGLSVKSVRLPREGGEGGRLRGFGYAEFETRQDLVDALTMNELLIKNRKIRVDIASGADGDQEQAAGGMGAGRGRGRPRDEEREDRTPNDWRNAPREGPPPGGDRGGFRGGGDRGGGAGDRMDRERAEGRYDAGFNPRDRSQGSGPPERSSFGPRRDGPSSFGGGSSSFGRERDGPSSFSRDRDGPSSFGRDRDGPSSFSRYGDREGSSSFSRGGDRDGPPRGDRPIERAAAAGGDGAPKERQKLSLKPRTVAEGEEAAEEAAVPAVPVRAPASSASIFGSAKPVDTAARERAIEERLKEKQMREPPIRGRESDRQEDRNRRDDSHGSGGHSAEPRGRGRSAEGEKLDHRQDDDRRPRDGPSPNDSRPTGRDNEYRPPQRSSNEYRPPARSSEQRPSAAGDYRPPARRTDRPDAYEPRRGENGAPRGGGAYRPSNGGTDRSRSHEGAPAADGIRRLEEPKQPVFENKNKFAFLVAEDDEVESDGRDDQQ